MKCYKGMVILSGFYGCEMWMMREDGKKKIQVSEMWFPRNIIRQTAREILNTFELNKRVDTRNCWIEVMQRREDERYVKQILKYKPKRRRDSGIPLKGQTDKLYKFGVGTDQETFSSVFSLCQSPQILDSPVVFVPVFIWPCCINVSVFIKYCSALMAEISGVTFCSCQHVGEGGMLLYEV
jgi:hypothetical protein